MESGETDTLYCPGCGKKLRCSPGADGAVRLVCPRCGGRIFSKRKRAEIDVKLRGRA